MKGIKLLVRKKQEETGISSLAAFFLSSAMRVGPGNILGVTGAISDLGNILIVFANIPLLFIGAKYVFRATAHLKRKDDTLFYSEIIGRECEYWDNKYQNSK